MIYFRGQSVNFTHLLNKKNVQIEWTMCHTFFMNFSAHHWLLISYLTQTTTDFLTVKTCLKLCICLCLNGAYICLSGVLVDL